MNSSDGNRRGITVRRLQRASSADTAALADLLADAVDAGASVGYLPPLPPADAAAWAAGVADALGPGLAAWLAELDGEIVGTVQLGPCLKPNGRHRGEVMKLLVHRRARGRGVASALMTALEAHARASGLTLLILDTALGSPAEAIYRHLGWQHYGNVPGFAMGPQGRMLATACFYRQLAGPVPIAP